MKKKKNVASNLKFLINLREKGKKLIRVFQISVLLMLTLVVSNDVIKPESNVITSLRL